MSVTRLAATATRRRCSTLAGQSGAASLYSYGVGYLGSLGTGSYDDVAEPTRLESTTGLAIKELSAGWAHAGFVTQDGRAFTYGRTHSFRDVIRATNMQRVAPWLLSSLNNFTRRGGIDTLLPMELELPEGERVKKMVCSTALTVLLTESGKLFTLGANAYGQCGNGQESVSVAQPHHVVLDDERVVDVAAGYQHGLAVTEAGNVFSWGKGERGQLGFGSANVMSPHEILALKNHKVVRVDAGFNHSTAVTKDGELFVWGKLMNPNGKEDGGQGDQVIPRLIKTREPIRLMQCSHFHTSFITGAFEMLLSIY
jgi:alpha-tubulin suppressor-like RCC1 family protein